MAGYVYRGNETIERMAAIEAFMVQQRRCQEAYRTHRRFIDWLAREPWPTREVARRYAMAIDTAPDLDSTAPQA